MVTKKEYSGHMQIWTDRLSKDYHHSILVNIKKIKGIRDDFTGIVDKEGSVSNEIKDDSLKRWLICDIQISTENFKTCKEVEEIIVNVGNVKGIQCFKSGVYKKWINKKKYKTPPKQ